jgi:hypothetical protein
MGRMKGSKALMIVFHIIGVELSDKVFVSGKRFVLMLVTEISNHAIGGRKL